MGARYPAIVESCSHGRSAAGGRGGNALAEAGRIPGLAGTSQVQSDWAPVARRIREEATDTWDDKVAVDRRGAGGHVAGRHLGLSDVPPGDR
jgi:hypothetical protein